MGIPLKKVATRWLKDPGFRKGYEALEEEFAIASAIIAARTGAKLTQGELAEKMHTSQSTIARLESGTAQPSMSTLKRLAQATGMRLKISLEPKRRRKKDRGRAA
jgi:transcriptional regulator with XRE-family HTH domain